MKFDPKNPFDVKFICWALYKNRYISHTQVKEVLSQRERLYKQLENLRQQEHRNDSGGNGHMSSLSIIDVLAPLNLARTDDDKRTIDEDLIYRTLAKEWRLPFKKIDPLKLDFNVVTSQIPRTFALNHLVLPIAVREGRLRVATPNPFRPDIFEDISRASHMQIQPVVSPRTDVLRLIEEFFGFKHSISAAEHLMGGPTVDLGNLEQYVRLQAIDELPSNDQHVVNAVNHLLVYAFDQRASDIHIEPKRESCLVRLRIDGVLHTVYKLPKSVHSAIISRIKTMSRLDISEKRKPQDGRIKTDQDGREAEIRVSTVPVAFGEKMVMRLMDPDILFQKLDKLGFSRTELIRYHQFARLPHGVLLVTGPTGSGKSTTLYSTLRDLSTPQVNITTVEDPIEMIHQDFNQIAVQPAIDVTFSSILRNILRQDPDIIMIGEIRDLATAEHAIQAALTGHLVLSTLHTNDAASSVIRLLDLGVPHFLMQTTLVGILAQRLLRTICLDCMESFEIESAELKTLGLDVGNMGTVELKRGKGCQNCRNTGYHGRTGIYEVLPYSETIKRLTTPDADVEKIRTRAREEGMLSLRESAINKMLEGKTTYQEVLRVTYEQE